MKERKLVHTIKITELKPNYAKGIFDGHNFESKETYRYKKWTWNHFIEGIKAGRRHAIALTKEIKKHEIARELVAAQKPKAEDIQLSAAEQIKRSRDELI